ncbi:MULTISPECIES: dephospho-CoA kinase [unclassified Polynucleobacter]|uniref:dephospho-CoA kinase n=1 Tax=unclassified Polynucleobacter TaxID=2640945 RepID=UPI001EEADC92|nr:MULTISPECIES: dephospho-CoA kinase [unclassified Polynucleobacter]MCE7526148.1 dephospho-CoA kinase [Polynucleobacter sp. IMCC 30228]MCE7528455.1 dephospho-CoA kinase [Polynucleobacter sp. IMCC 29146]
MAQFSSASQSPPLDLSFFKGKIPLVGLTGGIGAGKSAIALHLAELGASIIDSDQIAHLITGPNGAAIEAIRQTFGASYLLDSGALNRSKMRQLIFAEPQAKLQLEAITHPLIREETLRQAQRQMDDGADYLVFVVPLLIESGLWLAHLNHLVVVDCSPENQIMRVMQRSQLKRAEVEQIMQSQVTREARLIHADTIINNDGDLALALQQTSELHQRLTRR